MFRPNMTVYYTYRIELKNRYWKFKTEKMEENVAKMIKIGTELNNIKLEVHFPVSKKDRWQKVDSEEIFF